MNLLQTCNADVHKAILDIKESHPKIGEKLIFILQKYESAWEMPVTDVMWFAAHLPLEIWDRRITTFFVLFCSLHTTPNS